MKKILLLIILLSICFNVAKAQAPVKAVMSFNKAAAMKKISKSEFDDLKGTIFKKIVLSEYNENIYLKDAVLITYFNSKQDDPKFKKSLESKLNQNIALHSGFEASFKSDSKIRTAKIVTINNIRFALFECSYDDKNIITFTSDYNMNYEFIYGIIQYNDADYQKAHTILDELLNSMHYNY